MRFFAEAQNDNIRMRFFPFAYVPSDVVLSEAKEWQKRVRMTGMQRIFWDILRMILYQSNGSTRS